MLLAYYALQDLEALSGLAGPHLELLVEHLLVLVLYEALVRLVVLLDDAKGLWLHGSFEELLKAFVVHLVLIDVHSQVPVDHVQEDLFELVQLLHVDEATLGREELVRVKDIRVELLCHQG